MSNDSTNAKPRRAGRGFARSAVWAMLAVEAYRIGAPSANACLPFLPVAFDGTGLGEALLWGALP